MSDFTYNVLTAGNAIVDILSHSDDEFLVREGIIKGAMNLIDLDRAEHLYGIMTPELQTSGGSAANTAVGVASLGGSSAYLGKVCDDELGSVFCRDIRDCSVHFDVPLLSSFPPTARSMIFVTPDGERSMNTYLGACVELGPEDVDESVVAGSAVTYFEGYLWDPPRAKDAIRHAADIAHKHNRLVALALSDSHCVDRFRDEFLELLRNGVVDILFANEPELNSLYQTDKLEDSVSRVSSDISFAVVTLGSRGSLAIRGEERVSVSAHPVSNFIDSTGAGDMYVSGFLFGLTTGLPLESCARLGGFSASSVIEHLGPRPKIPLRELLSSADIG